VKELTLIIAAAVALFAAGAAQAGRAPLAAQKQALAAVSKAAKSGKIDAVSAAAARAEITRATHLIRTLPAGRREHVNVALAELGAFTGKLTQPRAVSLIGQLKLNDDYFSKHYAPAPKTDVTDADGVVYRYFAGRCLEFHPLANFGALNALVAKGDAEGTRRLADALIARGVYQKGGGIAWEYTFPYGGPVPWLSGMAQAVAAQSFARAARLVIDQTNVYMREAHAAFATIPGHLLTSVTAGPWIRLYSFQKLQVLNAQLQAVVSLTTYAGDAEDAQAGALAARMAQAAVSTLPRFDTGYWTYYALPRDPSPLDYQQFVVQLLKKLAPSDARFADAASRFATYEKQPPAFMLANAGVAQVRFWLSKPSSVQVVSGAGPEKRLSLSGGWHTLAWNVPKRPGIYPVQINAVDWAGNRASFEALPIVRATSTLTPKKPKRTTAAAPAATLPSFAVGAGLEDPARLPLAQKAGLRVVRLGVAYPAAATAPDPGVVTTLQSLTASSGVVVELNVTPPFPVDPTGVAALAAYAASLAQQVPALRDLVLAPAPSPAVVTPTAYATVFAAVRDAVHGVVPTLPVVAAIDGAQKPKSTVPALARALGGVAPDAVAFRPAPQPATNLWTAANVPQLVAALAKGFGGTAPPVLIDGLATPTAIPPAEAAPYVGAPPTAGAVSPVAQGTAYAAAITAAACSPNVTAVILDRLVDNPTAAPSGIYYANGDAKEGLNAVAAAVANAQRGLTVCPGVAMPAVASTIAFPSALASGTATPVQLGCSRDCVYLVTLDNAAGRPVVATRGLLTGGAAPVSVTLPKATLAPGVYTVDVRLASQVNPGKVTRIVSPAISAG